MSVAIAGLAMGFLGSSHCVAMCGGIAGALSAAPAPSRGSRRADLGRSLAYNAGRIASYSVAGALAGGFGAAFAGIGGVNGLLALRALAAVLIVAVGLYLAGWSAAIVKLEIAGSALWRRLAPLVKLARASDSVAASVAFGALWGWLPCGLVYSALAVAAAAGSATTGALTMAAFGLGTLPATVAIGVFAGRGAGFLRSHAARRFAGAMVIAFGVWTFAAAASAWSRSSAGSPHCHTVAASLPQSRVAGVEG